MVVGNPKVQKTKVSLPESLQELSFGYDFNRSLRGVTLPSGLRRLE